MPKTITYKQIFRKLEEIQHTHIWNIHTVCLQCQNGYALFEYGQLISVELWEKNGQTKWYYTCFHDYSKTTCKWLKRFDARTTKERRSGLKDGRYTLISNK